MCIRDRDKLLEPIIQYLPIETPSAPEVAVSTVSNAVSITQGSGRPDCADTNTCVMPGTITIKVGDTVTWINDDTAPHYITSGSTANGQDGKFTSSLMKSGDEFTHTFLDYGEFTYFDMIIPWIQGTVIVEE